MPAQLLEPDSTKGLGAALLDAQQLKNLGRRELRQVLAVEIDALRGSLEREAARARFDAAIAIGKQLYALGRSDEALPLAQSALSQARRAGDPALLQTALTACGILSADAFDIVRGVEYHLQALRLATEAQDKAE